MPYFVKLTSRLNIQHRNDPMINFQRRLATGSVDQLDIGCSLLDIHEPS